MRLIDQLGLSAKQLEQSKYELQLTDPQLKLATKLLVQGCTLDDLSWYNITLIEDRFNCPKVRRSRRQNK